jgi:hypothetical protein
VVIWFDIGLVVGGEAGRHRPAVPRPSRTSLAGAITTGFEAWGPVVVDPSTVREREEVAGPGDAQNLV